MDAGPPDAGPPDAGPMDAGPACPIGPGSLVIDEVMISSVSGSGDRGEWFEIVSTLSCTANLAGLTIVSPTGGGVEKSHTIASGTIRSGQYFVFALSSAPADNHGLSLDYAYGTGGSDDVILNNSADWLELRDGATVIDRVAWPSGGFTNGASRQYPGSADASANDNWSLWCDSVPVYSMTGGTFHGTPQAANRLCP